jgi:hypothetical protein
MEAVARAVLNYYDQLDGLDMTAVDIAEVALTALWDASRVVDIDQLPDDAVYLNDLGAIGFVGSARDTCEVDRMEYVLYWGKR